LTDLLCDAIRRSAILTFWTLLNVERGAQHSDGRLYGHPLYLGDVQVVLELLING
jgi:hypothetical protein